MTTSEVFQSLSILFDEIAYGAGESGFILNGSDAGLIASLDRLTAGDASASSNGGATIAAHVEHVRYGLSLMNRWAAGEKNPFGNADWAAAWRIGVVSDDEWAASRVELRRAADAWRSTLKTPRDLASIELTGVIGSIAHLAYHLGAIRQIAVSARGPREGSTR